MIFPFIKAHGLGNDFVILDGRSTPVSPTPATLRRIADRRLGVGCDQIVLLAPPVAGGDVRMQLFNSDGTRAGACGNASRCVARLVLNETGKKSCRIETGEREVQAEAASGENVAVDMGFPAFTGKAVPLVAGAETEMAPPADVPAASTAMAVGMGNPHLVLFVPSADDAPVEAAGPVLEHHPAFPDRTNVEFVEVAAPDRLKMRVWERGAGRTAACGTGACASQVAAARLGLADRTGTVEMEGGSLDIDWRENGHVFMTGPAVLAFEGETNPEMFA